MIYGNPLFEIADSISNRALRMVFYFSFAAIILGALLMIMHWPYGRILLYGGLLMVFLSYFASFIQMQKTSEDYINLLLIFCFSIGSLLRLSYIGEGKYLLWVAGSLITWKFIKSMID